MAALITAADLGHSMIVTGRSKSTLAHTETSSSRVPLCPLCCLLEITASSSHRDTKRSPKVTSFACATELIFSFCFCLLEQYKNEGPVMRENQFNRIKDCFGRRYSQRAQCRLNRLGRIVGSTLSRTSFDAVI